MQITMPHLHVRLSPGGPSAAPSAIEPSVVQELVHLDRATTSARLPGDRVRPLGADAWAVGRGGYGGVVWRLLRTPFSSDLPHPAWLWRTSRWFDPTSPGTGTLPGSLPLRAQLDPASRLAGGSASGCAELLAGTVSALRSADGPLAVVVPPEVLADPAPAGRWFILALLTLLPRATALRLRASTWEVNPDPRAWDLVIVNATPHGFRPIHVEDPPPAGTDIPASFILDRLRSDDPEEIERAADWVDAADSDPWGAGIRRRWDPPAATRGRPTSRPPPGSPGASSPPRRLRLNTPEAWLSLSDQSEGDRAAIVRAWIQKTQAVPPSEAILGAVIQIRPRGRDVTPWIEALLAWCDTGPSRSVAARELGAVLDVENLPLEPAVRASLWTEHVAALLELGQFGDALAACDGPAAGTLIDAGAGEVVIDAWTRLPNSRRSEPSLRALAERLTASPHGEAAVSRLWQTLIVQEQDAWADVVLQVVAERASEGRCCPIDELLSLLSDSPQAMRWVGHVARRAPPTALAALTEPVTSGPGDPLWDHLSDVRSQHASVEDQIADQIGMPAQQIERNERDLRRAIGAVRVWHFPDRTVAAGAGRLATLERASPVWAWLQFCASEPGQRPASGTASVVDALCARPPSVADEVTALWMMTEGLGSAAGWTPVQHAELLVRLALSPTVSDPSFALDLGASLARGMGRRPDAPVHLAALTDQMAMMPPGHPATQLFVQRLLPVALARGVPPAYLRAVQPSTWSMPTRDLWQRVVHSIGPPR